jgi:hypothetical protein
MASTARTSLRARQGGLIAASLVVTALTAATAAASAPSPMGAAVEPIRLGATASPGIGPRTSASTRPRTAVPGFLLDRGRYLTFDAPQAGTETAPGAINNRGQIVGLTLTGLEEPAQGARGFLLAKGVKGPFTPIDVPGAPRSAVSGINDRGQLVGFYENLDAPDPQPTDAADGPDDQTVGGLPPDYELPLDSSVRTN